MMSTLLPWLQSRKCRRNHPYIIRHGAQEGITTAPAPALPMVQQPVVRHVIRWKKVAAEFKPSVLSPNGLMPTSFWQVSQSHRMCKSGTPGKSYIFRIDEEVLCGERVGKEEMRDSASDFVALTIRLLMAWHVGRYVEIRGGRKKRKELAE